MSRGLILFLLSMASIGACVPIGGVMMETFPVWIFSFVTLAIASIVLILIATIYEKTNWIKLGGKNYFGMFMQALLSVTLYSGFLLYGLVYASPITVGIITSITPAVVAILAFFLLREKINGRKSMSILLAIVAVLLMQVVGSNADGGSNELVGLGFMLLAVVSLSLFYIYAKKFAVDLPSMTLASGLCFFGMLQTLPMAIFEFRSFDIAAFSSVDNWWGILLYSLFGWILAYIFTYAGISKISASTAGMATAAIPIVTAIVSVLFFGAAVRIVDVIALILVVASIIIAESQERKEEESSNVA